MIVGEDKPPLEEVIEHFGTKGMKWGIRKKNQTSLAKIGDRLNQKSAPKTRALVRNGAGWLGGQTAVMGLTVGALFAATAAMPATVVVGAAVPASYLAIAGASSVAALIQSGISAGITARDLAAIRASNRSRSPSNKKK